MSDSKALRTQLRIKTGVLNRLSKEHGLYMKEEEDNRRRLNKFIADGSPEDEWDVKNAKRILDESGRVILDQQKRLERATEDLRDLVASTKGQEGVGDSEEWAKADKALELVSS